MDDLALAVLSLAGCVFATSAAAKLRSRRAYRSFRAGLTGTRLVPGRMLPAAAASLAGAEAVAATSLLAAGRFVVLGDNATWSHDSRHIGYVPADRLLGIVVRRIRREDTARSERKLLVTGAGPARWSPGSAGRDWQRPPAARRAARPGPRSRYAQSS